MFNHQQSYLAREIEKAAGLYVPPIMEAADGPYTLDHMHHLIHQTPYDKCKYCNHDKG